MHIGVSVTVDVYSLTNETLLLVFSPDAIGFFNALSNLL